VARLFAFVTNHYFLMIPAFIFKKFSFGSFQNLMYFDAAFPEITFLNKWSMI